MKFTIPKPAHIIYIYIYTNYQVAKAIKIERISRSFFPYMSKKELITTQNPYLPSNSAII